MSENLTNEGKYMQLEKLGFADLRLIKPGSELMVQFPWGYAIQKARNVVSMYKSYYKEGDFTINDLGDGKCRIVRNA